MIRSLACCSYVVQGAMAFSIFFFRGSDEFEERMPGLADAALLGRS